MKTLSDLIMETIQAMSREESDALTFMCLRQWHKGACGGVTPIGIHEKSSALAVKTLNKISATILADAHTIKSPHEQN